MRFDASAYVDDPDAYRLVRKIGRSIEHGDMDRAEALCVELLELQSTHEDACDFLAARASQARDHARARTLAEQGLEARPQSSRLLFRLGVAMAAMGDHHAAHALFVRTLQADPAHAAALLLQGVEEEALGLRDAMLASYCRALLLAQKTEIAGEIHPGVEIDARALHALRIVNAAREADLDVALESLRAEHGREALERIQRAVDVYLGKTPMQWPHPLQRPTFLCVPDLPPRPWFEREEFGFLAQIEQATDVIREELLTILGDEAQLEPYVDMPADAPAAPVWRELNRSPRWSAFHLFRHGQRIDAHCARCPQTVAVLESLPIMRLPEHSPEALFSVLKPRTHIPPHTGVINGRLTVHLPLIVPENCGALAAGGQARAWEVGKCLVFDDSMVHEAWNHSDQTRAVLIFDIWNPYLRAVEREALSRAIVAISRFNRRYGAEPIAE